MATITPTAGSNAGVVFAAGATAAGGDEFVYTGRPLVIFFDNGHASDITVSFAPAQASQTKPGVGTFTAPTRSLAVTAGEQAMFMFSPENAGAYVNGNGRIAVTYTGHNAALKQRAVVI